MILPIFQGNGDLWVIQKIQNSYFKEANIIQVKADRELNEFSKVIHEQNEFNKEKEIIERTKQIVYLKKIKPSSRTLTLDSVKQEKELVDL